MTRLVSALQGIVDPRRVVAGPVVLREEREGSKCDPILVRYEGESWALRLGDGDHLPILADLPTERSLRRLPDYVVFSTPREHAQRPDGVTLQILICELKSSATGAESALRQVQLGKLLSEHLVRLAAYHIGQPDPPKVWCCGLIASPAFPASMLTKGRTRPGKVKPPGRYDPLVKMHVHHIPGGGEIHLESFY